jgi:hypothetical protein
MITTPTSKMLRNRLATIALLAGTMALAACSSSTTKATVPTAAPVTTAAAAPTAAPAGGATTAAPGKATTTLVATTAKAATESTAAVANPPASAAAPAGVPVLPVKENPIKNASTVQALKVESVHVEDNVDAAGKAVHDHLEVTLSNTGKTPLSGVEFYYTYTDATAKVIESYYAKLPDTFIIPAGGKRVAHFDNTGAVDHFPVNKFSVYYTSKNALDGTVVVSATGAAPQTTTFKKDAGGAEAAD